MPRSNRLAGKDWLSLPSRVLVMVGVLLGAYLTLRLPVTTVVVLLAALDFGILFYWFSVRERRYVAMGKRVVLTPIRYLADVTRVAGVLLIVSALWLTILGFLTEFGITHESTVHWSELAAMGFQVRPDDPALFGARCLVVGAVVWAVGFGLTRVSRGPA